MSFIAEGSRRSGRTTKIIKSMPDKPTAKIFFITFRSFPSIIDVICNVKGPQYRKYIVAKPVTGITDWGKGIGASRFYFDHTVFDHWTQIHPDDQVMITHLRFAKIHADMAQEDLDIEKKSNKLLAFFRKIFKRK